MGDYRGQQPTAAPCWYGRRDPNLILMRWRLGLLAACVGFAFLAWKLDQSAVNAPGLFGAIGFLATSVAICWAGIQANVARRPLLVAQIFFDTVAVGLLVHFTGGPFSIFPLAFCVPIMLAASFLDARWAVSVAGLAAVLTGGGHFGLALGWIWSGERAAQEYLSGWPVLVTAVQIAIFAATGMISGDWSRRLARRDRDQQLSVARVHRSRAEVRNILDNIHSGLITVDAEAVVTRANPSCCRILKLPEAELLGRNIKYVMSDGMKPLATMIELVASGGNPVSRGEVEVRRGSLIVPLGLNVNHVLDSQGEVVGAIAIFADLTREKELTARMREADRMAGIGELAASIAHEIRNPLASIRGSAELLADELELAGHQRKLFELVLKESGRVNTIITDFLTYSRMRPTQCAPFDGQVWRDEINLQIKQHISARQGDVKLTCTVEPAEIVVTADPAQLTQMALNLAINSCQAMNYSGELNLLLRHAGSDGEFEFVVRDTGPGIAEEIREDLFRPFRTTKPTGTGLGLSIAARIAGGHEGTLRARGRAGGGAEFIFRWRAATITTAPQSRKGQVAATGTPVAVG